MQQILSISQINQYIQSRMDADPMLQNVAVRGEISNYKLYPSGHHYFTLKDESGALKCVMFKGNAFRLRFRPENGMQVIAVGKITVFPRDGAYQLYCMNLTPDGIGDLHAAFEQIKRKLQQQGLFDPAHKKPIPKFPGTIGIVTSSAGAPHYQYKIPIGPCFAFACQSAGRRGSARDCRSHPLCKSLSVSGCADRRQGRRQHRGPLGI